MSRPRRRDGYKASYPKRLVRFSPDQLDFLHRRIMPFLDRATHHSIEHLMKEAYLQGLRDAADAQADRSGEAGETGTGSTVGESRVPPKGGMRPKGLFPMTNPKERGVNPR